jgi:citrate synthase
MQIGKLHKARTEICWSDKDRIEVWGSDLCQDLIGKTSFTDFFFLLVVGQRPSTEQSFFLDALLVAIAEHGLTPTAQVARMTLAAAPDALQAAVAAGLLGAGTVVLGTAELCGKLLVETATLIDEGTPDDDAVRQVTQRYFDRGDKLPGFGHPLHHPVDPRAERVIELAKQRGIVGRHIALIQKFRPVAEALWHRPLPLNLSGPIAAILLDLDFPATMIKAIPLLARTAGLLGHLAEEQRDPMGFLLAYHAEQGVEVARRSAAGQP